MIENYSDTLNGRIALLKDIFARIDEISGTISEEEKKLIESNVFKRLTGSTFFAQTILFVETMYEFFIRVRDSNLTHKKEILESVSDYAKYQLENVSLNLRTVWVPYKGDISLLENYPVNDISKISSELLRAYKPREFQNLILQRRRRKLKSSILKT